MPETIDLPKARELLARAVETQGRDFVYNPGGGEDCFYEPVEGADPEADPRAITACLVGVALDIHGETRQHGTTDSVFMGLYQSGAGPLGDALTYQAARYFQQAQQEQDAGKSWGAAYDAAEASLVGDE